MENGREAVEATTPPAAPFDLVLMDLQMPEMGGLEAAQAIREREQGSGGRRLPLVALTAHAMQGDRQRCLDAGMDGYLAKPIDVDELIAAVEHFGGVAPAPAPSAPPEAPPADIVFDERAALAYSGGDRRLLADVVKLFRSDYPSALRRIERALRRRDGEALRMAAHGLKGAVATVGGTAGRQAAADLEQMGKGQQLDGAPGAFATLRREIDRLNEAFIAAGLVAPPRATRRSPARKRKSPGSSRQRRSS